MKTILYTIDFPLNQVPEYTVWRTIFILYVIFLTAEHKMRTDFDEK